VASLQELWEGNGQGMHEGCEQKHGNGKGIGNLAMTKKKQFENRQRVGEGVCEDF